MIYTYRITYNDVDDFGEIEFCAKTETEASELFNEWCMNDNKMTAPAKIKSIETVHNKYDAAEYGKNYGCKP